MKMSRVLHLTTAMLTVAMGVLPSCEDTAPPPPAPGTNAASNPSASRPKQLKGLAALNADIQNQAREPDVFTPPGPPESPHEAIFVGLRAPTDAVWRWEPPRNSMRVMNWVVPAPEGAEPADLVVTHFPEAPGNTSEANIHRWTLQFRYGDLPAQAEVTTLDGGQLPVTLVELEGEYLGMSGGWHKADYAMIVAMVDAPAGSVYIKLLGPAETVSATRSSFMEMIDGLRAVGGN